VHTAETGRVALELIAANAHMYTLCLVDTVLPDIEPYSLCANISKYASRAGRAVPLALMASSEGRAWRIMLTTSSNALLNPRLLRQLAPYDVASTIR